MDLLREMIHAAADCKADTAKFQLYDPETTFGSYEERDEEKFSERDWKAIYDSRLTRRQLFWIKAECDRAGINFLSSVSDLKRLSWLEEAGVKRYKIASDDAMNVELCKAIFEKGKEVVVSNGMLKEDDWPAGEFADWDKLKWLYCISEYPTPIEKVRFIDKYNYTVFFNNGLWDSATEGSYDGFSDHTVGVSAAVVAMSLGARIIEKHFTLDKTLPGPDHVCSADPEELKQLCRFRDDVEKILYKDY